MQLLAILTAILLTYLPQGYLERLSPGGVLLATPPLEEGAKALAAWSFAVQIFPVSFGFGLGEAIWELSRKNIGAALAALITHALFGLAAQWGGAKGGRLASFGAALCLHWLWNYLIYRLQGK